MANEEIQSPPYPLEGTTAVALYHYLRALRAWIDHYRKQLNTEAEQDVVPQVIRTPKVEAYLSQPVPAQFLHLTLMRTIREQWDGLIRNFEDAWDCQACLTAKAMLVQHAAIMFNGAFTPHEVREMHAQRTMEQIQRVIEKARERLRRQLEETQEDDDDENAEAQPTDG